MLCSEIMHKNVECCHPDDTCQFAAQRMRDRDIGFLPVCEHGSKRVAGTLTDRDICLRVIAAGNDAKTLVKDVMSREVVTCRVGDDVHVAEKLMSRHQKARIICVDESGDLAGVISFADLSQWTEPMDTAETLRKVKAPHVQA